LTVATRVAQPEVLVAAPPFRPSLLRPGNLAVVVIGGLLAVLIGFVELEYMLPILGAVLVLVAMLLAPVVGLYALLAAIAFSPTFGVEDAGFSISVFEPLAVLLVIFWLMRCVTHRTIMLPCEGLLGALLLLVTILFLAGGGATSYPLAIKETLKWVLLIMAYVFTRMSIRSAEAVRGVLAALFVVGSAEAIMGAVQFVLGIGPPAFAIGGFMRAHGMFGQPNPFAGYLGTILPLALVMMIGPSAGWLRWVAAPSFVLIAMGIILSLSRGAWLGLAVSFGVMLLAWSPRARRLVLPLTVLGIVVIVLGMLGALPATLSTRITAVTSNFGVFDVRTVDVTSDNFAIVERMAHWQAGWLIFLDHPFLGVGPGNYPAVYEQYYIPPWILPLGHAHNYYLNMAAEAGVPGLLALLLVLVLAFRGVLRRLRTATTLVSEAESRDARKADLVGKPPSLPPALLDPPMPAAFARLLAIGLLGSLTMFSVHNMFDNLLVHGVGIQLGVLLGLIGGSGTVEATHVGD
jgi:O-antigen ligase